MKYSIIGYGKMGQTIDQLAQQNGHQRMGVHDGPDWSPDFKEQLLASDVVIEFTQPESAYQNIRWCLEHKVKVVSGTTGWLDKWDEITAMCKEHKGAFFYASNFSIGVNIFFEINRQLARLMNGREYDVEINETHHIHKKDKPSGTAITTAEGIIEFTDHIKKWTMENPSPNDVKINSFREDEVPGTHEVLYSSSIDNISIRHEAHSRQGFALGAITAAEWLMDKEGIFGMKDLLKF